nr:hypothetical protein CFP56_78234 [Quercus suber]
MQASHMINLQESSFAVGDPCQFMYFQSLWYRQLTNTPFTVALANVLQVCQNDRTEWKDVARAFIPSRELQTSLNLADIASRPPSLLLVEHAKAMDCRLTQQASHGIILTEEDDVLLAREQGLPSPLAVEL